ncbi:MAG: DUF5615 family PIN-like protein [Anaerolineae bacterium]|nr:DUF5615 family PIN-like protein [Anaerolineae bacterium]
MSTIRFLCDEDFNNRIVRGLVRRQPDLELVRVQDTEVAGRSDSTVLEWASENGLVILSHDVNTMTKHAFDRMQRGIPVAGLIEVPQSLSIGHAIEDILTIAECSTAEEIVNRVMFLPL